MSHSPSVSSAPSTSSAPSITPTLDMYRESVVLGAMTFSSNKAEAEDRFPYQNTYPDNVKETSIPTVQEVTLDVITEVVNGTNTTERILEVYYRYGKSSEDFLYDYVRLYGLNKPNQTCMEEMGLEPACSEKFVPPKLDEVLDSENGYDQGYKVGYAECYQDANNLEPKTLPPTKTEGTKFRKKGYNHGAIDGCHDGYEEAREELTDPDYQMNQDSTTTAWSKDYSETESSKKKKPYKKESYKKHQQNSTEYSNEGRP